MDDESVAGVETNVEEGSDLDTGVEADESLSSGDSEDDTDWKAIAEQERVRAENYKTALEQKRQLRKKKPEPEAVEEDDEDDKIVSAVRKVMREEIMPAVAGNKVDTTLEKLVANPEKRKLVKLFYDTRIRQTGTSDDAIQADLQAALDLADAKKLRKTNDEIVRANQQQTAPPFQGGGSDRGDGQKSHKFSADQVKVLTESAKRLGADPAKFIAEAWKNQGQR